MTSLCVHSQIKYFYKTPQTPNFSKHVSRVEVYGFEQLKT